MIKIQAAVDAKTIPLVPAAVNVCQAHSIWRLATLSVAPSVSASVSLAPVLVRLFSALR